MGKEGRLPAVATASDLGASEALGFPVGDDDDVRF